MTGVAAEGVSQIYLTGTGDRSYFDIRSIYYYGFSELDVQAQLPVIHPVLDYSNVLAHQVVGGEFSYKINLTSLSRQEASFDAISQTAVNSGACVSNTADTAVLIPLQLPVARHTGRLQPLLRRDRLAPHAGHL